MTFMMSSSSPAEDLRPNSSASVVGLASLIREAMARLSADGWKRHASWLLAGFGRLFDVTGVFLFRNYPDAAHRVTAHRVTAHRVTAVRLHSWRNPVRPPAAGSIDYRVISWDRPPFDSVRPALEAGESALLSTEAPVLLVPVHAGDEWWGVLGVYLSVGESGAAGPGPEHPEPAVAEPTRLVAQIIGDSVLDSSIRQALRWSERLHRIQRDIAMAAGNASSTDESLAELLDLICEFGEFSAAAVDIVHEEGTERIARHGSLPGDEAGMWCDACRQRIGPATAWREPRYFQSDELEHSGPCTISDGDFHAVAVVPLGGAGSVHGAMSLFARRRTHVPETVQRSLEAVASEVSTLLERVRSERTVRAMAERYRLAARAGRIGVWEFHPGRRRFLTDEATLDIIGATAPLDDSGTIDAQILLSSFAPQDRVAFEAWLASALHEGHDRFERECRLPTDDGANRLVVVRGRGRPDFDGALRVVGTVLDVTETRQIQSELQRARHLLATMENMVDEDRAEAGRLAIRPEPVDTEELFAAATRTGETLAREAGLDFRFRRESALPPRVEVDARRVQQVLLRLISNAITYTASGSVTLRARWERGRLRLAVVDTGPGIAAEERGRVFLPYRRRDGDPQPGSGLGLSVTQELVRLMGSRIRLASIVGKGSAFWFTIAAPSLPSGEYSGEAVTAVVATAGDLPDDLLAEVRLLARIGDVAAVGARAREALASARTENPFLREVEALAAGFRVRAIQALFDRTGDSRDG